MVSLFTKDDDFEPTEKGQTYLDYQQAMWWESRLAAAFQRTGNLPEVCPVYPKGFAYPAYHPGPFQSHNRGSVRLPRVSFYLILSYVLRKQTLRSYLELLRFEVHLTLRSGPNLLTQTLSEGRPWRGHPRHQNGPQSAPGGGPRPEEKELQKRGIPL